MEFENIVYDIKSQYHMLRHFDFLDEKLENTLISEGYSIEDIKQELFLPGSRFSNSFATDIPTVLLQLKKYGYSESEGLNGNKILVSNINLTDFPKGIGTMLVLSIESLNEIQKSKIIFKENRKIALAHLQVEQFPTTNTLSVILKKKNDTYQFITAFPGTPAMPLPETWMDIELLTLAKSFWDNHVFLFV